MFLLSCFLLWAFVRWSRFASQDRGIGFLPCSFRSSLAHSPKALRLTSSVQMEVFCHKLGQSLKLTEREGAGVVIPDGLWSTSSEDFQLFLVGRLLSTEQPKFEALVNSVKSMLNSMEGLEMRRLEEGQFLIRFNDIIDRNQALEGCPWSFEKNVLILNGIGINENPMNVDLHWVAINITQPLVRALRVRNPVGDELVVSFTYERLQNFYHLCRRLGHISASSELRFEKGFQDPGKATTYGALLRAPPGSWGVRKPWKTTDSPPVRRNLPSYIARGSEVFGRFATIHEPVESSARRGKGIIHAESEDAHRKVGEGMVDNVHFASSDGLGSHVPETGIPVDNDLAMSEDEAVNPSLGGCWESIGSLCSSSTLIGRSNGATTTLVFVPVSFAVGTRGIMAHRGRGRRQAAQ
ncbi:UNVERIFIED_CONTAM: hypothetical protein Sradi_6507000 [Sesamum radiatum]|uniref:DUF4283 domain-containing protein n=1 Tax=Sesamum radiatum TaxID=300843 RepID=A0AAW2JV54_SESRA